MERYLTSLIRPLDRTRDRRWPRLTEILDVILTWSEVARQRRQLATFDDRMLSDLGLSSADVDREINRPFWNVSTPRR